jgi:predicted DNA-binding transcriptional regulator AlpA
MTDRPVIVRRPILIPQSGLMTVEQTAAYLGMSRTNFYRLLRVGNGPPESKVVPHRFLVDDVDKWLGKAA